VLGLWAYPDEDDTQQIAALATMYSNDPDSLLRRSQVKLYADGEISHTTAALSFNYKNFVQWAGPTGLQYFDPTRLERYVTELEAVGFDMHIHTIGNRGVTNALDAIEAARATNGNLGARHRLTHVYLIDGQDEDRFAQLDVTVDFQPWGLAPGNLWFFYSPYIGSYWINNRMLLLRTLYDTGARVVLSSDFDVGVLNPFAIMEAALTRGAESLPNLAAAVRAYTIDPAYLMRQEQLVGSIERGKRADLVVLDRDPFSLPLNQLDQTRVLLTLVDGREVWRSPNY
jgi:hypothetical protein